MSDAGVIMSEPGVIVNTDDLLDRAGVADYIGVKPTTISTYLYEGVMPEPAVRLGRTRRPVWTRQQIDEWVASRPGQGAGGGRPKKAERAESTEG
jgi:predicted DNA-binding transcriptional regulator AlpA